MIVVTLGGNAILPEKGTGTIQEQRAIAASAMGGVADLIARGERVVLSHGNGPIVGNILLRNEAAMDVIPPMPLDICGADSQGGIGYMLQQVLGNELRARGIGLPVVSLVTQCVVAADDPALRNPTKPIGPFYPEKRAEELKREKGWEFREDSGRGMRRVVPSPYALEIVEWEAIRTLVDSGVVVIAAGGGGVPVVADGSGGRCGVEAVIDKDQASAVLAGQLGAEKLVVLTGVDRVALDYGRPTERALDRLTLEEAREHLAAGQFPPGSMGPKIEACLDFLARGGHEAIVTSPVHVVDALDGRAGTRIVPGSGVAA
jgi:carbamate kinase